MKRLLLGMVFLSMMAVAPVPVLAASFKPYDMNLTEYTYPYPVSLFEFQAQQQNLAMAYMDIAPEPETDNGKVVVLLHGKNFSGAYWKDTIAALTKQGYRVIVPDQIGFGKSTKPAALQYSFQALSRWTHELMESLGLRHYAVVGHSMGGMLAARYALMYPKNVTRLVLVNPIGLEDWKTSVPYRAVDKWYEAELQLNPDKIRAYQKKAYFDGKWRSAYDKAIQPQAGWTLHKDYPRIAWNSALHYDMIFTQPVVYEFDRLSMPVLLLIGTRDRTALGKDEVDPERAKQLGRYDRLGVMTAGKIPQSTLVEFKEVGHMPQVEIFSEYIRELGDFLAK